MPRAATYSTSRLALMRRHFGLGQQELAALLGVTPALVSQLESGRRAYSATVAARLAPFLAALPPETAAEAAARHLAEAQAEADPTTPLPALPAGEFEAEPLSKRRAACLHEAGRLRGQLLVLAGQAIVAARWTAAMPGLLAALPPALPEQEAPTTREAVRLRYVHAWLPTVPLALPPAALAAYHLAYARLQALTAEAAALAQVVPG